MDVDLRKYTHNVPHFDASRQNAGLLAAIAFLSIGVVSLGMMSNVTLLPLGVCVLIFNTTAWVGLALLLIRGMNLAAFYIK